MEYVLTPEGLQEISIRVVSQFMTKQADLTTAIANEAKTLRLNPDQIKRVIENSNTIAYLRQLEDASDRSFEFPIAEYKAVMAKMILPDQEIQDDMGRSLDLNADDPMVDSVNVQVAPPPPNPSTQLMTPPASMSDQEKIAMVGKETLRLKQVLVKMAGEEDIVLYRIEESVGRVKRDEKALEKLAHVAPDSFNKLAYLCGLDASLKTNGSVFRADELTSVTELTGLLKEASALIEERHRVERIVNQAQAFLLEKKALRGPVFTRQPSLMDSTVGSAMEGVGYAGGKAIRGTGKAVAAGGGMLRKGFKALVRGLPPLKVAENAADIGAGVLTAADTKHENPVWDSIHN